MTLVIRVVGDEDVPDILTINQASTPHVAPIDFAEWGRLRSNGAQCYVAARPEVTAYLISFSSKSPHDGEEFQLFRERLQGPFLYIDQVAVAPLHRHSHIGRALYHYVESQARSHGVFQLCCEVNVIPPNPLSMSFHRAMHFEPIIELALTDHRRVALMVKNLAR